MHLFLLALFLLALFLFADRDSHASEGSTVTYDNHARIRDLEEELCVTLFERERNGLRLTDAGHTALWYAREVLRHATAMTDSMRAFGAEQRPVSLKIGYIATALPGFLADRLEVGR